MREKRQDVAVNNVVTPPKAKRNKPIVSEDELIVRVHFAEPSEEAEKILDIAVERIYLCGVREGIFTDEIPA